MDKAKYNGIPSEATINKTIEALIANGMTAELVQTKADAKNRVLEILPEKAEVLSMTSISLEDAGLVDEINASGKYASVRNELMAMNRETQTLEMQKLGAAPEWAIGSVHGITEDGTVVVVSNTGSQLPAYAYGSAKLIWVVGAQKIGANLDAVMQRIQDYVIPIESERAREAYGLPAEFNSFDSKTLIVKRELVPGRIHIIVVNEPLGF